MQTPKYQALLYYGIEENEAECDIFHAFRAVDPSQDHDDDLIAAELAEQLDNPDEDHYQCRSMYIELPDTLVHRIQSDAVTSLLRNNAETFIRTNPALAAKLLIEIALMLYQNAASIQP